MQKCDWCDNPAVVHEVTVKAGIKTETHLCESHAQEAGFKVAGANQPVSELLSQFMITKATQQSPASPKRSKRKALACSSCGMRFNDFRKTGVLGCAACYGAFERLLGPLIERSQNGAVHHIGKTPQRSGDSLDRQLLIKRLTKELEDAISAEHYERAVELRDRLHTLQPDPLAPLEDVEER